MNTVIIKTLVAGKRVGTESDSPRELVPVLVSQSILDEDEFDLRAYTRKLEEVLNDEDTSEEEFYAVVDRIKFLGGSIEWVSQYLDGTGDVTAFINL